MQKRILLELENIGCLTHSEVEFRPGFNIIKARNASGKSSLIRGFTSMFSDRIPPAHILSLDNVNGRIRIHYGEETYEKNFRRTPNGSVVASGCMLPFTDHRAFDACVALAETGVVHKITGGGAVFRGYLENLSYGSYYSTIVSVAQNLVNESSRELAGSRFAKFEELPVLLTELTELHVRRDQVKEKIRALQTGRKDEVHNLVKYMDEKTSALLSGETRLAELGKDLVREIEKEHQLLGFLKLTDDSAKVTAQIKASIISSRSRQKEIKEDIKRQTRNLASIRSDVESLKRQTARKKAEEGKELEHLEKQLERVNKAAILKEEEIQQAEKFPLDDQNYPDRLVIEVRREIMKKIEWLNKVIEYFQEKYMRRMTAARLRFNRNVTKAFEELDLKGFEDVFLDQDFILHLVRENSVQQPVETLSASEKLTISLILMLAAKQAFLPDFPLFIIDELTLSYDPERFKQIVNYIKQRVPYVIVTSLTAIETGKLQVVYEA